MSAQGPTCALARFSFVTSTRAKARHNFNRSGPFLRRDLVPFYSAIDTPGYRRTAPIKRPKLDPYVAQIDNWLAEDKTRPRKQRHTAKKIFERLRDECRFDGGYGVRVAMEFFFDTNWVAR